MLHATQCYFLTGGVEYQRNNEDLKTWGGFLLNDHMGRAPELNVMYKTCQLTFSSHTLWNKGVFIWAAYPIFIVFINGIPIWSEILKREAFHPQRGSNKDVILNGGGASCARSSCQQETSRCHNQSQERWRLFKNICFSSTLSWLKTNEKPLGRSIFCLSRPHIYWRCNLIFKGFAIFCSLNLRAAKIGSQYLWQQVVGKLRSQLGLGELWSPHRMEEGRLDVRNSDTWWWVWQRQKWPNFIDPPDGLLCTTVIRQVCLLNTQL